MQKWNTPFKYCPSGNAECDRGRFFNCSRKLDRLKRMISSGRAHVASAGNCSRGNARGWLCTLVLGKPPHSLLLTTFLTKWRTKELDTAVTTLLLTVLLSSILTVSVVPSQVCNGKFLRGRQIALLFGEHLLDLPIKIYAYFFMFLLQRTGSTLRKNRLFYVSSLLQLFLGGNRQHT